MGEPDPQKLHRSVFTWLFDDPFKERKPTDKPPPKFISADEVVKKYGVPRRELERYVQNQITQAEMFHSLPVTLLFVIAYACMVIVHDDAVVVRAVEDSIVFDIVDNANFAFDSDFMGHKDIYDVNSHADFWSWLMVGFMPLMFPELGEGGGSESTDPGGAWGMFDELQEFRRKALLPTSGTTTRGTTTTTNTTTTTTSSTTTTSNATASNQSGGGDDTDAAPTPAPGPDPTPAPPPRINPEAGILLHYNRIVGGLRMIKEDSTEQKCMGAQSLVNFYGMACYGFAYPMNPMSWTARRAKPPPANETWFYVADSDEDRFWLATTMQIDEWFDAKTEKIQIAIPIYTAEFGLHTLITVNFYMSHGGHIWKQILPLSAYGQWYTETYYIVYDVLWLFGLFHIFYSEMKEVSATFRLYGCIGLWNDYIGFWNAVDWLSVIAGFVIVSLAYVSFGMSAQLNAKALELATVPDQDRETYNDEVHNYLDILNGLVKYVHFLKVVLSCYPLIIVLRLFKAFSAQPRLALVTETLRVASVDLLHFLIVFCCVFFVLSVAGMMLFGRSTVEFETFPNSINAVFRLCLGDFDWVKLRDIDDLAGPAYLAFVIMVLSLLLLNITLAMVMDGYSEVKKASVSSDTLVTEVRNIILRTYNVHRGRWVPLPKILDALGDLQRQRKWKDYQEASQSRRKLMMEDARKGPILLGRDTKAVVGMVVEPVSNDIKKFAGWGKVHQVGHGHRKCRVVHEDGIIREYDIGQDLNYELKLLKDEVPIPFHGDEVDNLGAQVMSTERLIKVLAAHDKNLKMSEAQAVQLMKDTVIRFYKDKKEDENADGVRAMVIKVAFREDKIRKGIQGMKTAVRRFLPAADEVRLLGGNLKKFYKAVAVDREHTQAVKTELEREIQDLRKRLLVVQPSDLSEGLDDVREVSQLHASSSSGRRHDHGNAVGLGRLDAADLLGPPELNRDTTYLGAEEPSDEALMDEIDNQLGIEEASRIAEETVRGDYAGLSIHAKGAASRRRLMEFAHPHEEMEEIVKETSI
mmetsp:Transcript_44328/g.77827  ORF Transcript_44328/g.77827 Transcript_44328/m.77827 type:complete len:1032 (-) Transcript_44328:95-3190(-)